MARNMVTRLVKGTEAEVKVININTDEITTQNIVLTKTFAEDAGDKVKREVDKHFKNTDFTVIKVLSFKEVSKLYGVPQATFMANAVELDPETRKVLATGEETTED